MPVGQHLELDLLVAPQRQTGDAVLIRGSETQLRPPGVAADAESVGTDHAGARLALDVE